MTQSVLRSCVFAAALVCGSIAAHAREAEPEPATDASLSTDEPAVPEEALEQSGGGPQFSVDARSRLTFQTQIQGTAADVQVSHSGLTIGMRQQLTDRLTLQADLGFEFSYYDFSGGAVVEGVSDPFSDLYGLGGFVTLSYALNEQWAIFGAAYLGVAGEAGADIGDSLLGGGGAGAVWRPSDWFNISFGLAVRSRLEDDALFTPIVNFSWRLSETMRLESRSLPQGGGLGLTWELDDTSEFTLFGGVEYRQWRLDGGHDRLRDGVLRDLRVPLGASMLWRLSPQFSLEVEGGAIVYQQYEFLDRSGNKIEDLDSDIAPFVGVKIKWVF